ncbi:ATP-binding protein [Pleurocapsa sp. PCC 7319]|uniref:sensor histidine kinase n=1 Tax=Pleurocapsa sp. PCC 7319 TaxID=118161 RepID=UPI00034D2428|nr:ATP-binding protein [Pleurocapsa sp. PCC 7319]
MSNWIRLKQWKALPVRLRGGIIIAIPVVCLFTSLGAFAWLKASLEEEETVIQHTKLVKLETKRLLTALVDTETGVRGYGLTHREEFLAPYNHSREVIPVSLNELESLVQDYPQQKQRLEEIRTKVDRHLEILQQKLTLQQELKQTREEAELLVNTVLLYDWLEEGKDKMNATRIAIDDFTTKQEELLEVRQQHQAFYRQITWIVLCLSAIAGTMGALLAILLFLQLERELRERETRLQNTNRELELACAQLDRFTANASHELRAPLAAVLSNAQVGLMELEDLTEDTTFLDQRLEKIVHLTKGMSTLVGDLLFLARQESLLSLDSLEPINVVDLLRTLTSDWKSKARSQDLTLTAYLPDQLVMVKADANLLRQAIDNLLSNACRYTPADGSISLRLNSDNDKVFIEVEDTGIGISPQSLPHIFERFYRVNQTGTKAKGSFGLGLNIAQQIVQAHGGQITVTSKVGQGSTFRVVLPSRNRTIED